jgi:hypothetical protein
MERHQNFCGHTHIVATDIIHSVSHKYLDGKTEATFSITELHPSEAIQKRRIILALTDVLYRAFHNVLRDYKHL